MSDWLGALIGGAFGLAGSFGSNAMSVGMSKELQEHQAKLNWKYAKKNALEMPGFNRQGLEAAGYNPMLALGNLQGAQSSWSASNSLQSSDMSNLGNNAISNAISLKQQENQNNLTEAQVDNYNADSVLKNYQTMTQVFEQLEKQNRADLYEAEKKLTDKKTSNFEREQAREDIRLANEIDRTQKEYKVGMLNAGANMTSANANRVSANANATSQAEITRLNRIERKKKEAYYNGNTSKLNRRQRFQQALYNFGQGVSDVTGLGRIKLRP